MCPCFSQVATIQQIFGLLILLLIFKRYLNLEKKQNLEDFCTFEIKGEDFQN